jgi:spore germination cell wall hydrolase CwlJ-like protein
MVNTNNILRLPHVILIVMVTFLLMINLSPITKTIEAVYETVSKTFRIKDGPTAKYVDPDELKCMTDNIYFEAGNQSSIGKIAVGRVVLNRLEDKRYPSSVCGVVYHKVKSIYQFSWVSEKKHHKKNRINTQLYAECEDIAYDLLAYNSFSDSFKNILFYHADYVNPSWFKRFKVAARIDNHIFYKE